MTAPSASVMARPAARLDMVSDNVWSWIYEVSLASPIQPISNLSSSSVEFHPPDFLLSAHAKALETVSSNQYAPTPGVQQLKQTIADLYSPLYARQLDPKSEILISSGAQEGLLSCVMGFIEPGDEVILLEPVFSMYQYQVSFAGGTIKYVPLRPPPNADKKAVSGNDWTLDLAELEAAITPRTKMIYFNTPHNPLGKVFTRDELIGIGNLAIKHDLLLISDEVFERIAFEKPALYDGHSEHIRIASLSPEIFERTMTVVSMGKLFNATGWRVGWVVGPERLMKTVTDAHVFLAYSSSTPAQVACAEGLREAERREWWRENGRDVARRCQVVCEALDEVGLTYTAPAGGVFVFANIDRIAIPDDYKFPEIVNKLNRRDWKVCYFLVQEFGISSIPGSSFYGPDNAHLGASYLRLGCSKSEDGLKLARERLLKLKPYIV